MLGDLKHAAIVCCGASAFVLSHLNDPCCIQFCCLSVCCLYSHIRRYDLILDKSFSHVNELFLQSVSQV